MRKIYLFFLVAMLMPLLAVAQDYNKSLTFANRTGFTTGTDDIVGVDLDVMGAGSTTASLQSQSFTMGTWFRLSKLPDYTVMSYQFADAILMGYRGLNHMNNNGCLTIGYQRSNSKLKLYGFGWSRLGVGLQEVDATLTVGEWHFVAFAVDFENSKVRVFFDDTLAGEFDITGALGTFDDSPEAYSFGGFGCMGAIDDSYIYNTALTLDDIKNIIAGRPDRVEGLKGWYTFDKVVDGTTGSFANNASGSDVEAVYYSYSGSQSEAGLISGTVTTATADLSTITEETARTLPILDCTFTVPSASDYQNVAALTFTANGETLTAGEAVTLDAYTEITINVTPATGYTLAAITVNGTTVENGGTFTITSNLTSSDIVITLGQGSYALTVANTENLSYTLTNAAGEAVADLNSILEGTPLKLVVTVPFTHTLNAVRLGETELTANNGTYEFEMPGADATLTIDATAKTSYAVNFTQPEGATLTVAVDGTEITSGQKFIPGQVITITATPDSEHFIRAIKANGTVVSGGTLTMPESDVTITVEVGDNSTWNKSITYINNTSVNTSPEDRVDIDHGILGVSSQAEFVNKSISVGVWVRMTQRASAGNQFIRIGGLNHNNDNPLVSVCTDSNGELTLDGFGIKDSNRLAFGSAQKLGKILPLNEWHYVAVTFDFENGEIRSYYDGEKFSTLNITATSFGGSFDDSPYGFGFGALTWNGSMDDIHIVDGAITDADAFNLYSDNAAKVANLVGWYTFDEIKDGTTNHYANQVTAKSDYDAIYYKLSSSTNWGSGLINNTRSDGTPDMTTITVQLQRPYITTELENDRTVTVASADANLGSVAITSPATEGNSVTTKEKNVTVKATPAEGYAFINWTDGESNVVATTESYTYNGENDVTLTANFGGKVTYTVSADGTASVVANGAGIASETVLAIGTEVTVTVTPDDGKECIVTLNGSAVTLTDNAFTFNIEANAVIDIQFVDQICYLNFTVSGNGSIQVWTGADDAGTPYGTQLQNGDQIPANTDLHVWFIPANDDETLESVVVNNGGSLTTLEADVDYYNGLDAGECDETAPMAKAQYYPVPPVDGDILITATFSQNTQGIEEIGIDPADGPVEYFNLQGVRVAADNLVPGFYIIRQGSKTAKVLIRK